MDNLTKILIGVFLVVVLGGAGLVLMNRGGNSAAQSPSGVAIAPGGPGATSATVPTGDAKAGLDPAQQSAVAQEERSSGGSATR